MKRRVGGDGSGRIRTLLLAVLVPSVLFVGRMILLTNDTSTGTMLNVAAVEPILCAAAPMPVNNAPCDVIAISTKANATCVPGVTTTYPLLITGVGGNLQEATLEWFRCGAVRCDVGAATVPVHVCDAATCLCVTPRLLSRAGT
jgi:hypothetical protein